MRYGGLVPILRGIIFISEGHRVVLMQWEMEPSSPHSWSQPFPP
jgi:hypothetical protein